MTGGSIKKFGLDSRPSAVVIRLAFLPFRPATQISLSYTNAIWSEHIAGSLRSRVSLVSTPLAFVVVNTTNTTTILNSEKFRGFIISPFEGIIHKSIVYNVRLAHNPINRILLSTGKISIACSMNQKRNPPSFGRMKSLLGRRL